MAGVGSRGFEEQFHWIFILVAGALILGFFFTVAQKQRSLSAEKLQLSLVTDVEDIFVGALVSKGTAQVLPLPPQGLGFSCTRGCDCNFEVSRAKKSFGGKSFFGPDLMTGDDALVWTLDWKVPYRASNFVLVTNPQQLFVFVYDEDDGQSRSLHDQVVEGLPPQIQRRGRVVAEVKYINVSVDDLGSLEPQEYERTRFVFLGIDPDRVGSLSIQDGWDEVSGVSVDRNAVGFYAYDDGFESIDYISYAGLPSVYAAIFSQDSVMYACSLGFAFKRLGALAQVYEGRAQSLQSAVEAARPWCSYQPLIDALRLQRVAAEDVAGSLRKGSRRVAEIGSLASNLEQLNQEVVLRSCPELF